MIKSRRMQLLEQAHGHPIDWVLWDFYVRQHLSLRKMARLFQVNPSTVYRWLQQCEIAVRPRSTSRSVPVASGRRS